MRILHVIDFYPPFIGGMEQHVARLSEACVSLGHEVHVVTMHLPDTADFEVRNGVSVHRVRSWTARAGGGHARADAPFHPPFPDPGFARALNRVAAEFDPDVIHPHGWSQYSSLSRRLHETHAVVVTLHDYGSTCVKKNLLYSDGTPCSGPGVVKCVGCSAVHYGRVKGTGLALGLRAARPLHAHADRFVAISRTVLTSIADVLPANMPTEIIPPFLVRDPAPQARPDWVPADGPYLMFVGALGTHKGIDVLMQAYRSLVDPPPLVVVGTPQASTPAGWPDGVTVVTNIAHREVLAGWEHAHIAVVPSVWPEPFGLVAVEAMTFGVPVVAARSGALPDIVQDEQTGLVVPPGDRKALAGAIARLLTDPHLYARLRAGSYVRARRYEPGAVVDQNLAAYQRAIHDHRPR